MESLIEEFLKKKKKDVLSDQDDGLGSRPVGMAGDTVDITK